jgi:hypothetical protein
MGAGKLIMTTLTYKTICCSLKCTGKWPSMPYTGLCWLGRNVNVHAKPEKLGPSQGTTHL